MTSWNCAIVTSLRTSIRRQTAGFTSSTSTRTVRSRTPSRAGGNVTLGRGGGGVKNLRAMPSVEPAGAPAAGRPNAAPGMLPAPDACWSPPACGGNPSSRATSGQFSSSFNCSRNDWMNASTDGSSKSAMPHRVIAAPVRWDSRRDLRHPGHSQREPRLRDQHMTRRSERVRHR